VIQARCAALTIAIGHVEAIFRRRSNVDIRRVWLSATEAFSAVLKIERRHRLARWADRSTHLWVAPRDEIDATVGSSGLQFDRVLE
jgi:hypothetical protein